MFRAVHTNFKIQRFIYICRQINYTQVIHKRSKLLPFIIDPFHPEGCRGNRIV